MKSDWLFNAHRYISFFLLMVFSLLRGCRSLSLLRAAQGRTLLDDMAAHPCALCEHYGVGCIAQEFLDSAPNGSWHLPLLSEHLLDFVCTRAWTQNPLGVCWWCTQTVDSLDLPEGPWCHSRPAWLPWCLFRGQISVPIENWNDKGAGDWILGLLETCWCHQGGVHMECMMVTAGVLHQSTSGFRSPVLETAESRCLNGEWGWVKCPF